MKTPGEVERRLLSIVNGDRLRSVLKVMLTNACSLLWDSRVPALSGQSYMLHVNGKCHRVTMNRPSLHRAFRRNSKLARTDLVLPVNYLLLSRCRGSTTICAGL